MKRFSLIFSISNQPETYVELDPEKKYLVKASDFESKCGWSPFDGWELYGQPEKVVVDGKTILENSKIV